MIASTEPVVAEGEAGPLPGSHWLAEQVDPVPDRTFTGDGPQREVTIVEVGPRDGLQNEAEPIPTPLKIAFVDALSAAGLPVVEVTSFVNPKAVPRLADATDVMTGINRRPGVRYPVLIPNERGMVRALEANVDAIALFTAATDAFARANVAATIDETFARFAPVVAMAKDRAIWIRGYVSVAFGCPYAGDIGAGAVVDVAERLLAIGCHEVCLADTIGSATPAGIDEVLRAVVPSIPRDRLALHFHDTAGMAIANVAQGLEHGIRIFDAAAGGLGGCPFAPGAPGNLATESLLAFLSAQGLSTGVDAAAVSAATALLQPLLPRLPAGRA